MKHLMEMSVLDLNSLPQELESNPFVDSLLGKSEQDAATAKDRYMQQVLQELKRRESTGGFRNYFVPGTKYGIDECPKHRAFFAATGKYSEVQFRAGNRIGKTISGAFACSLWLVQEYPDWWYEIGARVFKCKTNILACGQTNESTRNIVQKELMGELGKIGTGMIPQEFIKKCWNRPQTPGTIDTVEVYNIHGDVCKLAFKSYEQKLETFVGTAYHAAWPDEEPPQGHYNEIVMRTAKLANYDRRGIVINTVTPLDGVTRFIGDFDRSADHLEGAARITADE